MGLEHEYNSEVESSRQSLASAFATVPWGVALMTPDGRFVEANAAYCHMVGRTLAELRQTDSLSITHVDDRIESRKHMASVLGNNADAAFWEKRFVRNGSEVVGVRGSLSVVHGRDHTPLHLIEICEDVSERNAAVEALRRASALVEIAGRVALVGGWTIDVVERKLVWSDVVAAIHDQPAGYSPSLAAGLEYFVPEHQGIIHEAVERCIHDGTPYDLELEKITASGRRIWARTIGQAERDVHGAIVRIQGAFQDISSRKQNERAAFEVAERLRVTLESITDAFCTLDRDWRFTYVNPHAHSLFGGPDRPLLGCHLWTELPQLVGSAFEDQVRSAISGELPVQFEHHSERLSRWFSITAFPSSQGLAIYFRDISEARVDRQRLELLEVSIARLSDMVLITEAAPLDDPGPRIQYVNEAFTRITGFQRNDVIGRSPRMLQGELTDRAELDRIHAALARFEPVHSKLLNYTKLGRPYWIEMDIVPVAFAGEACSHFVSIERDITERHEAEVALRTSRDEIRTLTEAMPQLVWMTDADGSNIYSNQQWIDYTGLSLEESLGRGWTQAVHADDQQGLLRDWQQAKAVLGVLETQTRLRRVDGVYRWWLMRGVAQLDAAGNCIKWIGTCTDIDDLILAKLDIVASKEALQNSERRFTDLLRAVHLLSVMLDLEGRITYCNDYLLSLTGWQRDEVIGRNWFVVFLREDPVTATQRFTGILARSIQSWERENEIVTRTGQRRTIHWSSSMLLSADGQVIGSASIGKDITESKRDQLALVELNAELESRVQARTAQLSQAREDADRANQAKSAFLAAMSHEIRTPMNGVIGMIDVLQQTNLNGPQDEMVDLVQESAISLLSIIDDILDFSKIEAGKLSIAAEPIDPGVVIERACALLAPMAQKRGVRLALFIDPTIPGAAIGDEGRFRQVVTNLVGNAIKFCSGSDVPGRVSVRALRVADTVKEASSDRADDFTVDLVITDNGVGMDEVTQSRLFTPFTQADASTTRRFGGTGLGLAICHTLVSLMKGHITVRSTPRQGSTFTVRLPFKTTATAPAPSVWAFGMPVGTMRCCIVGSEQSLADDLACTLRHSGWSVVKMPDLAAAAAATPVDGLSLWLVLPDQAASSLDALRTMAPSSAAAQTRFVVLGQGGRRSPRRESNDALSLDADALSRSTLFEALIVAAQDAQTASADHDQRPVSRVAPPLALPPVQSRNLRVLVAEDNEANRAVIGHQLRLLGLAGEVCNNGLEALDRWRGGDYGLLLTDLHMPVMDGYELTAAIRSEERPGRRLPIIALTANGLGAEELRCLAAGMDAYLIKPVRLPLLRAAMATWLDPTTSISSPLPSTAAVVAAPVDLTILAGFMGDDPVVIEEVLVAFRHSTTLSVDEFDLALKSDGMHAVADAAHKLKSAARTIGAERLGELCKEVEEAAQAGRVKDVRVLAPQFHAECRAVLDYLASR